MSEDNKTRTADEESLVAVLKEAYYMDGGTPKEFREMVAKNPDLSKVYNKEHHIFKSERSAVEEEYHESTDIY